MPEEPVTTNGAPAEAEAEPPAPAGPPGAASSR